MFAPRAERLVNLVICLLSTRRFLTAQRIRLAVPGYEPADGTPQAEEAFKRMFERDKAELRQLGIPLEVGRQSIADLEDGYRIARGKYELPEISLEPDEAAAVGLAVRFWQTAGFTDAARSALVKLRAAGVEVETDLTNGLEPRIVTSEAAFEPCLDAVKQRRPIKFNYCTAAGAAGPREVEPWGIVSWRGRWYLVGHDRERQDTRCFRLSRIQDQVRLIGRPNDVCVPTDIDITAIVAKQDAHNRPHTARLKIKTGQAVGLRRQATATHSTLMHDIVDVDYSDVESFADVIIRYGSDVVVLAPPELRAHIIDRLCQLVQHAKKQADSLVAVG